MPQQYELESTLSGSSRKEFVWNFHRLPKLIYEPFVWGKEDQVDWRTMKHSRKPTFIRRMSPIR